MSTIKKETFVYLIGTVLLSILNFTLSILYSDMFIPSDFGIYSLCFATYSLISQLFVGWISQSIIRYYPTMKQENEKKTLFGSIFMMHLFVFILLFVIFNTIIWISNNSLLVKEMYSLFTVIFYFESFLLFINTMLRSENNSKQYSINTNLNSLLKILMIVFLYYIIGFHNVIVIVISLLFSEIIQTIYLTIKYKLLEYFKLDYINKDLLIKLFKYGFPLIGVSITIWVLNVSDRYIIDYFFSNSEVGLYSYSYNLANSIISLLMQFIMLGAYPNIIKSWEEKGKKETIKLIKDYLNVYMLVVIPFCVGFIILGKEFFYLFTNYMYHNSYINFIITAIGITILGFTQYTNKVWELNKKTNIILILNIIAAATNIILNFIFIPKFGYYMGSVTTLISYLLYLIISILLSGKIMKLEVDWIIFFKIVFSTIIFAIVILLINKSINEANLLLFIFEIMIAVIIYISLIIKMEVMSIKEIKMIFKK